MPVIMIIFYQFLCFGYEVSLHDEETVSSSCKISMQLTMAVPEKDAVSGRAIIEVKLINDLGNPLAGRTIQLTSTRGTFLCRLPEQKTSESNESEPDNTCFITGQDGLVKVNLINLPLNGNVQVKATCDCGGYQVFTSGSLNYANKITKKKK